MPLPIVHTNINSDIPILTLHDTELDVAVALGLEDEFVRAGGYGGIVIALNEE